MKIIILTNISFIIIKLTWAQVFNSYENQLWTDLKLSGYNNLLRPTDLTNISLKLELNQIVGLNERTEVITTSSYLFISWNDSRLAWNSSKYGITVFI